MSPVALKSRVSWRAPGSRQSQIPFSTPTVTTTLLLLTVPSCALQQKLSECGCQRAAEIIESTLLIRKGASALYMRLYWSRRFSFPGHRWCFVTLLCASWRRRRYPLVSLWGASGAFNSLCFQGKFALKLLDVWMRWYFCTDEWKWEEKNFTVGDIDKCSPFTTQ